MMRRFFIGLILCGTLLSGAAVAATTRYGDYFLGTEYYVNFSTGTDDLAAGRGDTDGDPWKTIKFAVENITRDGTNGDRVNCKDNATHTVATQITVSTYAANATEDAPLLIQGYTVTANDGGVAVVAMDATVLFMSDTTFDFCALQDLRMTGDVDGAGVTETDQNSVMVNCSFVNSSSTGYAVETDMSNGVAANCYFEGERTDAVVPTGSGRLVASWFVNRGDGGCINLFSQGVTLNCLAVIEGNAPAGEGGFGGTVINSAVVCLGTPSATSVGIRLYERKFHSGNYVENMGIAYNTLSAYTHGVHSGNSYYNVTTPVDWPSGSQSVFLDDPVDTGSSIFVDTTQSTAAACDFTVKKTFGANAASNMPKTYGFVDGVADKTFQMHIDTGPGAQDVLFPGVRR